MGKLAIGHYMGSSAIRIYDYVFLDGLCLINLSVIYYFQTERPVGSVCVFCCMSNATKITLKNGNVRFMEHFHLRQTKELILIHSKLHSMPDQQLSHQHTLERLTITDNARPIYFETGFEDMASLQYLDLRNNQIVLKGCC